MAKELNLNIILDRKDVLYGQPYQDLTDKVIDRLQGR
jgi:Skp family chaperone for outer membrane proteins